jgi:hypothetical protein
MPFQWLQMRITEEKERRAREKRILDRLPDALVELYDSIRSCLESYNKAFGPQASEAELLSGKVRVIAREEREGKWQQCGKVEVSALPSIPGFQIDQAGDPLLIEIGILPGNKLSYRDRAADQYLGLEDLSRRILDRVLFPKLKE